MDMKRSMNVNIFLKQFKMSNDAIVELLREGDDEKIGAEKLKGLMKIMPTKDEVRIFAVNYNTLLAELECGWFTPTDGVLSKVLVNFQTIS